VTAKPEPKEPAPEKPAAEAQVVVKSSPGLAAAWIPAIAVLLLAPVASVAVSQFVLIPRFQKKLATVPAAEAAPAEASTAAKGAPEANAPASGNTYDFSNVVVNLSGTMGTRYLKTSFTVTGNEPAFKQQFDANKARLTDVTLNVLSALSLSDLEEPGSKNLLRDKLVAAYNQALGHHAVEQVYFSDFLIQ
jgi:flagellar protein FliL